MLGVQCSCSVLCVSVSVHLLCACSVLAVSVRVRC